MCHCQECQPQPTRNRSAARARSETWQGRQYLVAPLTLIVPGVLNGSQGALYYPPGELRRSAAAWNGMPITVNHPERPDGMPLSARDPAYRGGSIGVVRHPAIRNGKLVGEGWFDVQQTKRAGRGILRNLKAGRAIELSTGLFTDNEPTEGSHKGRSYTHIARNHRPDHLAVLPDEIGACSIDDGCGVLMNTYNPKLEEMMEYIDREFRAMRTRRRTHNAGVPAPLISPDIDWEATSRENAGLPVGLPAGHGEIFSLNGCGGSRGNCYSHETTLDDDEYDLGDEDDDDGVENVNEEDDSDAPEPLSDRPATNWKQLSAENWR